MKVFRIVFRAVVCMLALVAIAQISPGDVVADVPFAFSVAGETFPAGHYIVSQKNEMLRIFNHQIRGVYVPVHPALRTKSDGSKLVFHRYGDRYFLSAVWVTGNSTGEELFPSNAEHELKARRVEMQMAVVRPAQ